jgi:uncharacterized protein with PIN domain
MQPPQVKILCDHMLGSLAKWLRLLGYDTVYPAPLEDRAMAAKAYDEGRVLLTRDKDLAARVKAAQVRRHGLASRFLEHALQMFGL